MFNLTKAFVSKYSRNGSPFNFRRFCESKSLRSQVETKIKPDFARLRGKKEIGPFGWFLLIVPASTFGLGTWQMQRKKWKENLIRDLQERSSLQPVKLPDDPDDLQKLEYHPVHVKGTFLHDGEIYMGPRSLLMRGDAATKSSLISKGQNLSQGYLVITPFKLAHRDETILINRGWVPIKHRDPKTRPKGQVEGVVDVVGVVRLHENRPAFMPKNQGANGTWLYRDLQQMSRVTGAAPIYLDATNDFDVPEGPVGGQTRISLRNEHFSYIVTWYSLCGVTSFMWYRQFLRPL